MILIVDMPFVAHMSEYVVGATLSFNGRPTGIIYGSLSMLLGYIRQFKPTDVVLAWDSRHSLRKEIYTEYKGNRKPMNEKELKIRQNFYKQARQLRDALKEMGFHNVMRKGYEADDVIAEVCNTALDDVLIIAGDHDLFQLLRPGVRMWMPTKRKMATVKWLQETKGISPRKWAKIKAIGGCHSDNVKGIPGIGEKTAIQYMTGSLAFGSAKTGKIIGGREIISRNMKLVALPFAGMKHVPVKRIQFNEKAFRHICRAYGFSGMKADEWITALGSRRSVK